MSTNTAALIARHTLALTYGITLGVIALLGASLVLDSSAMSARSTSLERASLDGSERPIHHGQSIAAQGNQALRQIREDGIAAMQPNPFAP